MRLPYPPGVAPLVFTALVAALPACGEGDPARDLCELKQNCNCAAPVFTSVDRCVDEFHAEAAAHKDLAERNGLTYNPDCLDFFTADISDESVCKMFPADAFCYAVHGDQPKGAACKRYERYSDCADGLFCGAGTCRDINDFLPAGSVCATADGEIPGYCDQTSYCEYGGSNTCKPHLAVGATCPRDYACMPGLACIKSVCQPSPGEGEPCETLCADGLACDPGTDTCIPGPGDGEPCINSQCSSDTVCDYQRQICETPESWVCALVADDPDEG